jgi:hypothetical protein
MRQLAVALLALLAGHCASKATTIFSNFNGTPPGYVADNFGLSLISSPIIGTEDTEWAMAFTVPSGSDFVFTGFVVPLTLSGTTATVEFTLASNVDGEPGAALETIPITVSDGTAVYTGSSILGPTLIADTTYWLEGAISLSDLRTEGTFVDWNAAANTFSGLASGPTADRTIPFEPEWSTFTNTQAAFKIDGIAIPEPRYGWVLGLGCLLAGKRVFNCAASSGFPSSILAPEF